MCQSARSARRIPKPSGRLPRNRRPNRKRAPDPEPETEPPAESQSSSRFVLSLAGAVVLGGLILAVAAAFGARKRKSPGPPA